MAQEVEPGTEGATQGCSLEPTVTPKASRQYGIFGKALRSKSGLVGAILTLTCLGVAFIGPWVAPYSSLDFVSAPFGAPTGEYLLGADAMGRDALSRVLNGGQRILLLAAMAAVAGVVIGALIGVSAAYLRGIADEFIMRSADIVLAFPQIILALLVLSVLGTNLWIVAMIVAVIHAPQVARVARAAALRVIEEDYVSYAELIGTPKVKIIVREVLPNIAAPLLVELGLRFTFSVAIIAGLNFLGFGVQPPFADWGLMINENRIGLETNPWPVVVPVMLIAILTIGVNMLTDAIARAATN